MPKNTSSEPKTRKKLFTTSAIVTLGLLTALSIILERFLGIMPTPNIRIAFGNLPIILAGLLYGPVAGGIVGLLADFLGTTLFSSFAWFPPMALTPVIMGVVPPLIGRFMKKRVTLPTFIALILPAEILGPVIWSNVSLQMLNGVSFLVNLPLRAPIKLLIAVVDILLVFLLYRSGVFRALGLDTFGGGKTSELRGNPKVHSQR